MAADELHDPARQTHDLRERREVPERVFVGHRAGRPIDSTDSVLRENTGVVSDDRDRTREGAVGDGAIQYLTQ